jgi:hypothetical protein
MDIKIGKIISVDLEKKVGMIFSDADQDHYTFKFDDIDHSSMKIEVGQNVSFKQKPGKESNQAFCVGAHGSGGGLIGDIKRKI